MNAYKTLYSYKIMGRNPMHDDTGTMILELLEAREISVARLQRENQDMREQNNRLKNQTGVYSSQQAQQSPVYDI